MRSRELIWQPQEPEWARGYLAIVQRDAEHWIAIAELTFARARLNLCTPRAVLDGW